MTRPIGVIDANRRVVVTTTPAPLPGVGEALVDVAYCGLCGSDLHLLFGPPEPITGHVLGHEFSGVVAQLGPDVSEWAVGDRVVIRPIQACGDCAGCREPGGVCIPGLMSGPGLGREGALAQSVTVPVQMLYRVPAELTLRDAALTEPLAVAVRGVHRAQLADDAAVVVTGAGPIGALTLAVLQAKGLNRILVVEPNDRRRAAAAAKGVQTVDPDGLGAAVSRCFPHGVDAVFECSGHPSALQQIVDAVGYGTRVVLLGVPEAASEVHLMVVAVNELTIIGSTAYDERDFVEALNLLASRRIDTDSLITSVVELDQADAKLHELASGTSTDVKVLVRQATPAVE